MNLALFDRRNIHGSGFQEIKYLLEMTKLLVNLICAVMLDSVCELGYVWFLTCIPEQSHILHAPGQQNL